MSTQRQRRRGTTAELDAFTGAVGEIVYDTEKDRLRTSDGATAGGFELALLEDIAKNEATYIAVSGTDTLTGNLDPDPGVPAAPEMITIKAANTNTGAVTLARNGHPAEDVKKIGGTDALAAGDIVAGGIYVLFYDGTQYQLVGGGGGGGGASMIIDSGSATTVASEDIPDPTFADYQHIEVHYSILPAAAGYDAIMQLSSSATVRTSGYAGGGEQYEPTPRATGSFTDGFWLFDRMAAEGGWGSIKIYDPGITVGNRRYARVEGLARFNFNNQPYLLNHGTWNSSYLTAIDGLRFKMRGGQNFSVEWVMTGVPYA